MGEPCRDVACYVWEMGEIGEMGKIGEIGEMGEMGKIGERRILSMNHEP
jgi:hypothetical protein